MEPNMQSMKPTETVAARATSADAQVVADKVSDAAHAVREHLEARGAEVVDQAKRQVSQAKQQVSEAYKQTSKHVTKQYEKAIDYGRENPGTTTLIALGVGVGIGLLLGGSLGVLRSRVSE